MFQRWRVLRRFYNDFKKEFKPDEVDKYMTDAVLDCIVKREYLTIWQPKSDKSAADTVTDVLHLILKGTFVKSHFGS